MEQKINDSFEKYLYSKIFAIKKVDILKEFSEFLDTDTFNKWYLSLHRFVITKPLKFFDKQIIQDLLTYFNNNSIQSIEAIVKFKQELSHATFSLLRHSPSWDDEMPLALDNPKEMAKFENLWHPEYQRYVEHVLNHFIQIPLYILGLKQSKDYLSNALSNRIDRLNQNGFSSLTSGCDVNIRNAISHGKIRFEFNQISYIDRKITKTSNARDFEKLFDNLTNTCHSFLIALLIFLGKNKENIDFRDLPLGIQFLIIDGIVSHSEFKLMSMIESTILGDKRQLNISCEIKTDSRSAQLTEGMGLCWNILKSGNDTFDRFNISFDCGRPVSAAIFLDSREYNKAIKRNLEFSKLEGIIENLLLWYQGSWVERKLYFWRNLFKLYVEVYKREIIDEWLKLDIKLLSTKYEIVHLSNTSSDMFCRVQAYIFLKLQGEVTSDEVIEILNHAVRKIRKFKVKKKDFYGEKGLPKKPQCIIIRLHSKHEILRKMMSSSFLDDNLILIAEWISSKRIPYYYTKNAHINYKKIQIKFNPNTLK